MQCGFIFGISDKMMPSFQFLTMAVLMMVTFGVFSTGVALTLRPLLPKCSPGTFLATSPEGQDVCRPCPEGTYMDKYDRKRSCKRYRVCKKSEEILFNGTSKADVVCTCKRGERLYYNVDETYGYSCSPCDGGTVRQNVTGPFDKGDTGCCAADAEAIRDALGKLWCAPVNRPNLRVPSTTTITTTGSEVAAAEEMTMSWWIYLIIAASILLIIIAIAITIGCIVKRKQKQQRLQMKMRDDEQPLSSGKLPCR